MYCHEMKRHNGAESNSLMAGEGSVHTTVKQLMERTVEQLLFGEYVGRDLERQQHGEAGLDHYRNAKGWPHVLIFPNRKCPLHRCLLNGQRNTVW
jgi:hypothetical protein